MYIMLPYCIAEIYDGLNVYHHFHVLYDHCITSMHTFTHSDDRLDGYQKTKYVCKLLFIFLLGNDVDFGHQEAVNLLSSTRFSEKQIVRIL